MALPPQPPWELTGECVVALARGHGVPSALPPGVVRLPGPTVLLAASCQGTPVGSLRVFLVAVPARFGARAGLYAARFVVDDSSARAAVACHWGMPGELGTLTWGSTGGAIEFAWGEGGVVIEATPTTRHALPVALPLRLLQQRSDGPVSVRVRLRGRARPAAVRVAVDQGATGGETPVGRYVGATVSGLCMLIDRARRRRGVVVPGRVPLGTPDTARTAAASAAQGRLGYTLIRMGLPQNSLPSNSGVNAASWTLT